YKAATEHKGAPTVILAKTIKGYGLGEAGEGKNITHQQKKLNEDELRVFRSRMRNCTTRPSIAPRRTVRKSATCRSAASSWADTCRSGRCARSRLVRF